MALILQPRKRRPDDPQQFLNPAQPQSQVDPDPTQFKEDVVAQPTRLSPDAAEPPLPTRPTLSLVRPDAPVETDNTLPATTTRPRPMLTIGQPPAETPDEYDQSVETGKRLAAAGPRARIKMQSGRPVLDEQGQPVIDTSTNSKLKSGLRGMIVSAGAAANRALANGSRNPLAEALGAGAGGGIGGAIHDSWDEEAKHNAQVQQNQAQQGFLLERRKAEGDISDQESVDALRNAQAAALPLKTLADVNKAKGEILNAQQSRILEEYKAAGHYRAGENVDFDSRAAAAGMKLTPYEAKETAPGRFKNGDQEYEYVKGANGQYFGRPVTDASGKSLPAASSAADSKIPETFYRGKGHEDEIKNDAMAEVLAKPEYHVTGMRQDVLDAYGNDMDKVQRAIRSGELKPGEIFTDPTKGATFQRDLAATHSRLARDANGFDAALDMTSKAPTATQMTLADFQQAYQAFQTKFAAAKNDQERQDVSRRFQTELKRVRVR